MGSRVDVAVVGGGPSGAAAAYFLARHGHAVTVVEKATFPRDKTCGDGLTPRAVAVLDQMGVDGLPHARRVRGVGIGNATTVRHVPFPRAHRWADHGLVVRRRDLDERVLANAEDAGATVHLATEALHLDRDGDTVRGIVVGHRGRQHTIRARWTLIAEGGSGTLLRHLGRRPDPAYPRFVALREYCTAGPAASRHFDVYPDLVGDDGALLPGYGWAFAVDDATVNVGAGVMVGGRQGPTPALPRVLDRFVDRLRDAGVVAPDPRPCGRRGGRLFTGGSLRPAHGPGYLLVGDAAGMVNPASGEGIAAALETGRLAADHLDTALRADRPCVEIPGYTRDLARTYGAYYRLGRGLVTSIADPGRMRRLLALGLTTDRRLRFTVMLLTNLHDPAVRGPDQVAIRLLQRSAALASGWRGAWNGRDLALRRT